MGLRRCGEGISEWHSAMRACALLIASVHVRQALDMEHSHGDELLSIVFVSRESLRVTTSSPRRPFGHLRRTVHFLPI